MLFYYYYQFLFQGNLNLFYIDTVNYPFMSCSLVLCLLLGSMLKYIVCNLLCKGTFEQYTTQYSITYSQYSVDYSLQFPDQCWFYKGSVLQFQIMRTTFKSDTIMLKLLSTLKYDICQNVDLTVGNIYEYSFDLFLNPYITDCNASVIINGVTQKVCNSKNTTAAKPCIGNFTATQITNQLCLSSVQIENKPWWLADVVSAFVDNVSLIMVWSPPVNTTTTNTTNTSVSSNTTTGGSANTNTTSTQINNTLANTTYVMNSSAPITNTNITINMILPINASLVTNITNISVESPLTPCALSNGSYSTLQIVLKVSIDDKTSTITFTSEQFVDPLIIPFLNHHAIIYIQQQPHRPIFYNSQANQLAAYIPISKAYNIKDIRVYINQTMPYNGGCIQFNIQFQFRHLMAYPATESERAIVAFAQSVSNDAVNIIFYAVDFIQTALCSYYISNFVTFFSLIIIYNFLDINTQPQFSYQTLRKLAKAFFASQGNLITLFFGVFGIKAPQFNPNIHLFVSMEEDKERVPEKDYNFQWFNALGITYNFIQNNYNDFVAIVLLGFKLTIIYWVRKLIFHVTMHNVVRLSKFPVIIVMQFLCSSTSMSISALQSLKKTGDALFFQKVNTIFQISIFWLIFNLPALFVITSYYYYRKTLLLRKKRGKLEEQKFFKKFYYNTLFLLCQYSLYTLIPCFVVLKHVISFFVITSFCILCLVMLYLKGFKFYSGYTKIQRGLIVLVLLIHHSSFIYMYNFSSLSQQYQIKYSFFCKIAGIIVIWTVFVGSLVQLITCFVDLFHLFVISNYKLFYKICCTSSKDLKNKQKDYPMGSFSSKIQQIMGDDQKNKLTVKVAKSAKKMQITFKKIAINKQVLRQLSLKNENQLKKKKTQVAFITVKKVRQANRSKFIKINK